MGGHLSRGHKTKISRSLQARSAAVKGDVAKLKAVKKKGKGKK